ncbi:kinase-like domain-containing protein [Nemania sp. FL0031]|nr:kinase-like domain-containing protein [Nemania sp. FL0031]
MKTIRNGAETLSLLGVTPDSIWGDEEKTAVYAYAMGRKRAVLFRFHLSFNKHLTSSPRRIINCYHGLEVSNSGHTFEDRDSMRSAIWYAVAEVWGSCNAKAPIGPGTTVDIFQGDYGNIQWLASQDALFDHYCDLLRDVQSSDLVAPDEFPLIIDMSNIFLRESMGGRGCCKRVEMENGKDKFSTFAFKGITLPTYVQMYDDNDEFARAMVEAWRRSSKLIASMPPHPNIQSPPKILVSIRDSKYKSVLIGHLSPFFEKGDLGAVIAAANSSESRISLQKKAKWCHQMSLALAHTHGVMHTFHMDIKPGNFLVDDDENLRLIDWEQSGAPASTLAPEADGTWDVAEQETAGEEGSKKLLYTKYTGPERRNMPEGGGDESFNIWNVFPEWQSSCPRALQLAEVFALGRTMWMLLSQTVDCFEEVEHPNDVQVTWDSASDIPSHWIRKVEKCMDTDPNERPLLKDLVEFWEVEVASC